MPAKSIKIHLSEPLDAFVTQQTSKGGFASPADFILHLLQAAMERKRYEAEIDAKILETLRSAK